jgi:uncharacterized protein (TIGR04255 family)
MDQQPSLPRFRAPPVSEVAVGVQFQDPLLTPVHLGLYYGRIKSRFPVASVQPPIPPAFEVFDSLPPMPRAFPLFGPGFVPPRMWFTSSDESSLVQLQSGRLNFNWRGGLEQNAYPHFAAVQSEFMKALDDLEALIANEGLGGLVVNQCELVYVNPLPASATGVPLSEPQKIFRVWSGAQGQEWVAAPEDVSFTLRYRFNDQNGHPFGRLIATMSAGIGANGVPAFQLEMTARGRPIGEGRNGIQAFHNYAHEAIVRCFTAITTPEMHERWERYQ